MSISYSEFKKIIWTYYQTNGRLFDWRNIEDPYKVFISEVMLQQTQTYRVAPKYIQFINAFPSFQALAAATPREVLFCWQGLGYNRRGLYLYRAAQIIVEKYNGTLPNDPQILLELPGIGPATASSMVAFAYNKPTLFIETNIRSVFIYHFFSQQNAVADKEIMSLVAATVNQENPREWYYALMDYGVMLKKNCINPSRKSKHYTKQSKFEGSDRQIRGAILKMLTGHEKEVSLKKITDMINSDHIRVQNIVKQLTDEKIISVKSSLVSIVDG